MGRRRKRKGKKQKAAACSSPPRGIHPSQKQICLSVHDNGIYTVCRTALHRPLGFITDSTRPSHSHTDSHTLPTRQSAKKGKSSFDITVSSTLCTCRTRASPARGWCRWCNGVMSDSRPLRPPARQNAEPPCSGRSWQEQRRQLAVRANLSRTSTLIESLAA